MQDSPLTGTGVQILTITADQAGQRIDNFLLAATSGVPKSHIYQIIRTGQVRVNKGRVKATYRLQADDQLRIPPMHQTIKSAVTVPDAVVALLEEAVIFEDEQLLVINKPPGLAVHGGSGLHYGIIDAFRQSRRSAGTRLELAHRLDRGTSGCLIIGKNQRSARELQDLFRQNRVIKRYLGVVAGRWKASDQRVARPLINNIVAGGERRVQVSAEGKRAISYFSSEALLGDAHHAATLMKIRIETGRTHQIRVHAASQGYPVVGDEKYGRSGDNLRFRRLGLKRLFLHCNEMILDIGDGLPLAAIPDRTWDAGLAALQDAQ